jgi:hypothetical protein
VRVDIDVEAPILNQTVVPRSKSGT